LLEQGKLLCLQPCLPPFSAQAEPVGLQICNLRESPLQCGGVLLGAEKKAAGAYSITRPPDNKKK
jgi:hypothetical protein